MQPDILKGFMALRNAFQIENLKVPVAIVLESQEEGMRLLMCLRDCNPQYRNYFEEDIPMTSVKVMGIEVRWPSKKYAMSNGEVWYL